MAAGDIHEGGNFLETGDDVAIAFLFGRVLDDEGIEESRAEEFHVRLRAFAPGLGDVGVEEGEADLVVDNVVIGLLFGGEGGLLECGEALVEFDEVVALDLEGAEVQVVEVGVEFVTVVFVEALSGGVHGGEGEDFVDGLFGEFREGSGRGLAGA